MSPRCVCIHIISAYSWRACSLIYVGGSPLGLDVYVSGERLNGLGDCLHV